jgi:hypothetical protein
MPMQDQVTCCVVDDLDVLINGSVSGASTTGTWSTLGKWYVPERDHSAWRTSTTPACRIQLATGVDLILTATNTSVCQAAVDTVSTSTILPSVR